MGEIMYAAGCGIVVARHNTDGGAAKLDIMICLASVGSENILTHE